MAELTPKSFEENRWVRWVRINRQIFINEPRRLDADFDKLLDRNGLSDTFKNVSEPEQNRDKGFMILRKGWVYVFDEDAEGLVSRKETMNLLISRNEKVNFNNGKLFPREQNLFGVGNYYGNAGRNRWERTQEQIRSMQSDCCADCGEKSIKLQIHHRVPKYLDGVSKVFNAIGLAGEKDKHFCHQDWNTLAFSNHWIFPGIPIEAVPDYVFKKKKVVSRSRRQDMNFELV